MSLLLTHTVLYAPHKPGKGRGVQPPRPPWGRDGAGCWPTLTCPCSPFMLAAGPISPLLSKLQRCLLIAVAEITVDITVSRWHQALGCWKASRNFSGADLSGHVRAKHFFRCDGSCSGSQPRRQLCGHRWQLPVNLPSYQIGERSKSKQAPA